MKNDDKHEKIVCKVNMKGKDTINMKKEKMENKFKIYNKVIVFVEGVFVALFTIAILLSTITLFESNFDLGAVKQELLGLLDYNGELPETIFLITNFIKIIGFFILLECLDRIIKDTYKNKTPFLKQNINRIDIIAVFALIYSNIPYFIVMLVVAELFRYGYKLQKESDEIL